MKVFGREYFNTLGGKLLAAYLTAVTLAILMFFAILEYQNFQHLKQDLRTRLEILVTHEASVLAAPLWSLSELTVRSIIEAIAKNDDLLYVELTDEQGGILSRLPQDEHRVAQPELTARKSIVHSSSGQEIEIGAVEIAFHQDRLVALVKSRLWADAVILAITLIVVTAVTLWTTRSIIIAPLNRLLDTIHSAKLGNQPNPIAWTSNDELGIVMRSYNELQEQQAKAEATLRESEARFRQIAENIREVFWITDLEKNEMVYISPAYEEIWGRTCESLYERPKDFLEAIHPDDRERVAAEIADQARGTYDETYRIVRPDGSYRWIRDQAFPVRDEKGRVYHIVGIAEDITEIKQTEERLRQSQRLEVIGQLTGGVAHDFNNLLAVIIGNLEFLEESLGTANPSLQAVSRAASRGAELTHRLLAFSRKQTLQSKVVDLNAIVAGMTGLLRRALGETIEIEAVGTSGLWQCEVDPGQLENALLNLVVNARDAMPRGGKLTIEAANIELDEDQAAAHEDVSPGKFVRLSVSDDGIGMPSHVIERVFEPFFTTKEVGAGSGLGLSMVYGFVKQSGGHITIDSEEGRGSTIHLYLPKSEAVVNQVDERPVTKDPVARGEIILLVEDDEDVRLFIATGLSRLGYKVLEAEDGEKALAVLHGAPRVDLLLSDVVLPGDRNGPEIVREAQSYRPGIKSLFISGYAEREMSRQVRLPDGAVLLTKPFHMRDLASAVRALLDA